MMMLVCVCLFVFGCFWLFLFVCLVVFSFLFVCFLFCFVLFFTTYSLGEFSSIRNSEKTATKLAKVR